MTRHTKLHKFTATVEGKKEEILFRDLNYIELSFLKNIKNDAIRCQIAGKIAVYDKDPNTIAWAPLMQIGESAIQNGDRVFNNDVVFEMFVKECKETAKSDVMLIMISKILSCLPGQSFSDLLKLTPEDLLELVVICENITGETLIDLEGQKKKKGMKLTNPENLSEEASRNLRQQIAKLNSSAERHR